MCENGLLRTEMDCVVSWSLEDNKAFFVKFAIHSISVSVSRLRSIQFTTEISLLEVFGPSLEGP